MDRTIGIGRGQVWVNICKTDDGDDVVFIGRRLPIAGGGCKYSPTLIPKDGDILDLLVCLHRYYEHYLLAKERGKK